MAWAMASGDRSEEEKRVAELLVVSSTDLFTANISGLDCLFIKGKAEFVTPGSMVYHLINCGGGADARALCLIVKYIHSPWYS